MSKPLMHVAVPIDRVSTQYLMEVRDELVIKTRFLTAELIELNAEIMRRPALPKNPPTGEQ